ncbi:hypothetical protein HYU06_03435 [Candidatus Woesearchaeota archaeon]|nr:hypothetical protein [Candidatus Woesearchaeota archaeon]
MHGLDSTLKTFKTGWPDVLTYVSNGKVLVICDYNNLYDAGEQIFKNEILDTKRFRQNYKLFLRQVKQILYFENTVNTKKFTSLREKDFLKLFDSWNSAYYLFWTYSYIAELGNWGGEQLLTRKLKELDLNKHEIVEKLSAPDRLSFFQKEEIDFLKVKLIKNKIKKEKALQIHQENYYWLKNSYNGAVVLDKDYFNEELEKISISGARKKLTEINSYPYKIIAARKEIIKKYNLPKELSSISERLAFSIWWQDLRKRYIYIANHIISQILKQVSAVKLVSFDDLEFYTLAEIRKLLADDKRTEVADRKKAFTLYYYADGKLEYLNSLQSFKLIKQYEVKVKPDAKTIKGVVVSIGNIKANKDKNKDKFVGVVKILFTPADIHKLQKGEILVAPMTSPDYIFAMRKAAAIITDEGGLTSHAAIVSRELGIPCIVGTKVATKILKTGDKIEMDVKNGIVRKI